MFDDYIAKHQFIELNRKLSQPALPLSPSGRCIRHAEGTELNNFDVVNYIPEPATATLSLLALAGLAARRRRR